jgi:hypothetical protein
MNYCAIANHVLDHMSDEQLKMLRGRTPPVLIITPKGDLADLAVAEPSEHVTAAFKHAGKFLIGFMVEIPEESNAELVAHWYGVARHNGVIEEITPGQQVN